MPERMDGASVRKASPMGTKEETGAVSVKVEGIEVIVLETFRRYLAEGRANKYVLDPVAWALARTRQKLCVCQDTRLEPVKPRDEHQSLGIYYAYFCGACGNLLYYHIKGEDDGIYKTVRYCQLCGRMVDWPAVLKEEEHETDRRG